ncbi:MAG: AsmA family protein [Myxococcota bacterium]
MKKFVIAAVIGLLVLIAIGVFAFLNLDRLLERNRDRIAQIASEAAGRPVAFEKASAAFSRGLAIRIDGLRVAEDPRFGKGDFLALESGYVDLALWPLLQSRIEVRGIRLERPVIQLIHTSRGWNFESLGKASGEAQPAAEGEARPPMALSIAAMSISDGTIVYSDRAAKDGLALTIEAFESSGSDLSLDGPIAIDFSGRVRPTTGDAALASRVSGRIELADPSRATGRLRLRSPDFAPGLVGVELSEGDAREHVEGLDLEIGLPADAAKTGYPIALSAESAHLAGFDLDAIEGRLVYQASRVVVERLATGIADGRAELAGKVGFGTPGRSPFDLDLKVDSLDSDTLAHVLLGVPRGAVSGRVGGEFDLAGQSLDWDTLKRTIAGSVRLELDDGALEQVNLLDSVTQKLVGDPGLGQLLAGALRDAMPSALEGKRTPFDLLRLAVQIDDGRLHADDLQIAAQQFALSASDLVVGLDGSIDGEGRLRFPPEVSKKILDKADRFAPLLARDGVVVLPLRFDGAIASPTVRPDLAALGMQARDVATEELKEKAAKKLTDAIFGKKKDKKQNEGGGAAASPDAAAADAQGAGADAAPPETEKERQRDATKDLVKEGLGRLLGQ